MLHCTLLGSALKCKVPGLDSHMLSGITGCGWQNNGPPKDVRAPVPKTCVSPYVVKGFCRWEEVKAPRMGPTLDPLGAPVSSQGPYKREGESQRQRQEVLRC